MKVLTTTIFMLIIGLSLSAQVNPNMIEKAKAREASDPAATEILDAVHEKYNSLETMQLDFTLIIKGEMESEQKGKMYLKGEQYRMELTDQDVISNGNTVWFHLKENKEVQINNPNPEGDDFLSPAKMLNVYRENMVGNKLEDVQEGGKTVHKIEVKPRESHEEITKLRVTIDKETKELLKVIVFTRFGDRYIFEFSNLLENPKLSNTLFNFNPDNFPGIHVEDLRID